MERKFRDPIHHFITIGHNEGLLVDSPEFQRLRHIHQLALTSMVYPGATHKRFEHSLGVLHLAREIFDVVTNDQSIQEFPEIRELIPELNRTDGSLVTDRATVSAAALLHDIGHMPFSHAAETLLVDGKSHESVTAEMILFGGVQQAIKGIKPYLRAEDVARAAVKPSDMPESLRNAPVSGWQGIQREIIQSNIVGADRMDYLLRDAYHAGVAYGSFDVHRLVNGIRLLAYSPNDRGGDKEETGPQLGIVEGALQVAEQLQVARYLMFTQVYFHDTRVSYDISLKEFLERTLECGTFPDNVAEYTAVSDNDVFVWIAEASKDSDHPGHEPANRLANRDHFRRVYSVTETEEKEFAERYTSLCDDDQLDLLDQKFKAGRAIASALSQRYGHESVRHVGYDSPKRNSIPVLRENGRVEASENMSLIFQQTPSPRYDYVFVDQAFRDDAKYWLKQNLDRILMREDER